MVESADQVAVANCGVEHAGFLPKPEQAAFEAVFATDGTDPTPLIGGFGDIDPADPSTYPLIGLLIPGEGFDPANPATYPIIGALIPGGGDDGEGTGPTNTPLDVILAPLADAFGGFGDIDPADPSTYPLIGLLIPEGEFNPTDPTTYPIIGVIAGFYS